MIDFSFAYSGYETEIKEQIWNKAIIAFDTNSLLNSYKMSPNGRGEFFSVLRKFNQKLWIPNQVMKEFHKNRRIIIDEQLKAFSDTKKNITKSINELSASVDKSTVRLRTELGEELKRELDLAKKNITAVFETHTEKLNRKDYYNENELLREDPIQKELCEIISNKIGNGFSPTDLLKIYEEGEKRYELQIPPGFEDQRGKKDFTKYGDLVIWKELIQYASDNKKPVIFITEDVKPDWWENNNNSKTPHPELLIEFKRLTNQYFMMYTYKEFYEEAKAYIKDMPEAATAVAEMETINEHLLKSKKIFITMPGIGKSSVNRRNTIKISDLLKQKEKEKRKERDESDESE